MIDQDQDEKTVPWERFAKKVAENKALKGAVADQQLELDDLRIGAGKLEEATSAFATLKAETDAERLTHSTSLALSRAGITDADTADLVRWRFAKSDKSPEEFGDWLKTDALSDKLLAEVFRVEPTTVEAREPTPQPPVNGGTKAPPPPRQAYTAESVQNMTVDELRANYSGIMESFGFQGHDFSKP